MRPLAAAARCGLQRGQLLRSGICKHASGNVGAHDSAARLADARLDWRCARSARSYSQARGTFWNFSEEIGKLTSSKEYYAFFSDHQDHLSPADLCLLLEGLSGGRRVTDPSSGFMKVMNDVVWKLERFGPRDLPRLFAILHAMNWHDRDLFKIAEPLALHHLPKMDFQDLPRLATSYVEVQCGSTMLFDQIARQCSDAAMAFEHDQLAELVDTFSRGPHRPKAFLVEFSPIIVSKLEWFSPEHLARVVEAYARWPRDVSPDLVQQLTTIVLRKKEGRPLTEVLSSSQLVTILRALVLWKGRARFARGASGGLQGPLGEVFQLAVPSLLSGRAHLQPEEVAVAVWALAKMAAAPNPLFSALCEDLAQVLPQLSETGLAAGLLASARVSSGRLSSLQEGDPPAEDGEEGAQEDKGSCSVRLLTLAEGRVKKTAESFPPRELTSVVLAYALAQQGSQEFFAVLQKACMARCREFPVEQLASLLWSFATVRLGPSLFREVQFDVLDRLNQFALPAICDVLWSYCVVRLHDPQLLRALLSMLVPSGVAGDPRCALLCPAILNIRASLPDMDPEGLERYAGYARREFRRAQLAAVPSAAALHSVSSVLESLGWLPEELADVDGYVVDVVARHPDCEGPVAVLYHSPGRTLHLRTGEPLGPAIMRQRHLRQRGYGCVNLSSHTWRKLSGDERASLLRGKLAAPQTRRK